MLRPPPTLNRRKRGGSPVVVPEPAVAPQLVAASYVPGLTVRLHFDRAVSIAGIVVTDVRVDDGDLSQAWYRGASASLVDPMTVAVGLAEQGPWAAAGVTLDVDAANGIVALVGGLAWGGVGGLPLPFGP